MSQAADTTRLYDDHAVRHDATHEGHAHVPSPYDPVDPPEEASPHAEDQPGSGVTYSRFDDLKQLTKPRITRMVVITAAIGFYMALPGGWRETPWLTLLIAMVGTALSCMSASAFNQAYERDTDALMTRTRSRPVAAGRVSPADANKLGVLLGIAGVGLLVAFGLHLAAALCAFTIVSYAWVYTPMKRTTSLALIVGAIPGAMPPMIGYAAATESPGSLGPAAWLLFAIMFVWQVPHFLAIAWLYRDEYAKADLAMLPVIDPTGTRTFRQTLIGCLLMLPIGLLPTALDVSGRVYFFIALACGLGFLAYAVALVAKPTRANARKLFFASLIYLPVVMAAMLIDRA
ncbi:MAG: heme o synthase [Phycisphaerales bacterium JB063]